MPLYEYKCSKCGEKFEKLTSFANSHEMECPKCGSKETQKLIGSFATMGGSSTRSTASSCGSGSSPFR
jgi:putative FmdB family regulatory protein